MRNSPLLYWAIGASLLLGLLDGPLNVPPPEASASFTSASAPIGAVVNGPRAR